MINPSEISEVLRQQLESVNSKVSFEETGTVLEVGDGVAHVYGLDNVCANELVEFENGVKGVALNLEESNVGVILLNNVDKVTEGMSVKRTGEIASIPVGEGLLGRVINILGEPIDGRGPIQGETMHLPLERKAPGVIFRQPVKQPLQTGIKAIDSMVPIGRGQRELIIGDRQIGKTAIAIDTIINQRSNFEAGKPVYCIYVAIGQKASSVAATVETLRQHGALDYTVVVAATASDSASMRYYSPLPAWPSANTSATPAATPSSSTTTFPSRPWPIARYLLSSSAPQAARLIPAISSTSTHACSNAPHASSTIRKWPRR